MHKWFIIFKQRCYGCLPFRVESKEHYSHENDKNMIESDNTFNFYYYFITNGAFWLLICNLRDFSAGLPPWIFTGWEIMTPSPYGHETDRHMNETFYRSNFVLKEFRRRFRFRVGKWVVSERLPKVHLPSAITWEWMKLILAYLWGGLDRNRGKSIALHWTYADEKFETY